MKLKLFLGIAFTTFTTTLVQASPQAQYGIAGPKLTYKGEITKTHSYQVGGKRYTTKTSNGAKNFVQEGIASYYHHKFHGRRTSNGEIFNNSKFTAAHKTLPIGSYALVTNLKNGKQVIVRINDRGPFSKTRILDLSRAAASEIGLIRSGTGRVRIEALHVDHQGQLSGPATVQLAQKAKTPEALERIKTTPNNAALASRAITSMAKNELVTKPVQRSSYMLKVTNIRTKQQANKLLKSHKARGMLVQSGKYFELHYSELSSRAELNELKLTFNKMNNKRDFIVMTMINE